MYSLLKIHRVVHLRSVCFPTWTYQSKVTYKSTSKYRVHLVRADLTKVPLVVASPGSITLLTLGLHETSPLRPRSWSCVPSPVPLFQITHLGCLPLKQLAAELWLRMAAPAWAWLRKEPHSKATSSLDKLPAAPNHQQAGTYAGYFSLQGGLETSI